MTKKTEGIALVLSVADAEDLDETNLDQLTRALKPQLEEIEGIDAVRPATVEAAERGAKGFDLEVGNLLVTLAVGTIPALFTFLAAWVSRPGSRPLKIKAKGKSGEIEIEFEFDPKTLTAKKVQEMALALQSATNQ